MRHRRVHRHRATNSAIDYLRGTSSDMGNIKAEVLFPQRKKSNARELELMRLLGDLVTPRPESVARKVKESGEAVARRYLNKVADALQSTGMQESQARSLKSYGERAKRLITLDQLYQRDETFEGDLQKVASLLGIE